MVKHFFVSYMLIIMLFTLTTSCSLPNNLEFNEVVFDDSSGISDVDRLSGIVSSQVITGESNLSSEIIQTEIIKSNNELVGIRAYQFAYDPNVVYVRYGSTVILTVTSIDVGHGFALPDFGINERVPPEESRMFKFVADKKGSFKFFNPVYSGKGSRNMTGLFIVK